MYHLKERTIEIINTNLLQFFHIFSLFFHIFYILKIFSLNRCANECGKCSVIRWRTVYIFRELCIYHQKISTRAKNDRDVMCLPAHDVTVIVFVTFKMCYEHFHRTKLLHSGYLSQILWYKRYLYFVANVF